QGVAYRGLAAGKLDVIDVYTTDAQIRRHNVRVLRDDRRFFPPYEAVLLYRADLEERFPAAVRSILRLQGAIDANTMLDLNSRSDLDRVPEKEVAADFLNERFNLGIEVTPETLAQRIWQSTREHLLLVSVSLLLAILAAIPLGVVAFRFPVLGQVILALVGVVQTIPGLALLSLLLVVFGIGAVPAIVALFVYSLLPITRNTYAGLHTIPLSVPPSSP